MAYVVKQHDNQHHPFNQERLLRSLQRATMSTHLPEAQAQKTIRRVYQDMQPWLSSQREVSAADIRRKAAEHLQFYDAHAAYLYKNQTNKPAYRQHPTPQTTPPPYTSQYTHPGWLDIGKGSNWSESSKKDF